MNGWMVGWISSTVNVSPSSRINTAAPDLGFLAHLFIDFTPPPAGRTSEPVQQDSLVYIQSAQISYTEMARCRLLALMILTLCTWPFS